MKEIKDVSIETNLKEARLTQLSAANMSLAQGNYPVCLRYLWNFSLMIEKGSDARTQLEAEWEKVRLADKDRRSKYMNIKSQLPAFDAQDYQTAEYPRLEIETAHSCLELCWKIALDYHLVPVE